MRKETYKVLISTALGVAAGLSACEATGVTNFIPDSTSKTPNSTEIEPTQTEIAKITSASLESITNNETRKSIIDSLPANKPQSNGVEDVFSLKVGDKKFNFVMYELTDDEISNGVTIVNSEGLNTVQSVATYTEFEGYDGTKSWVRLIGITSKPEDPNIVWFYDPNGFPTEERQIDTSRAVFGYSINSKDNILFQPLITVPTSIQGYDYTQALPVQLGGEIPGTMNINVMLIKPEISPESLGIPEGAILGEDENGNPIYFVTNPAGETVTVGIKNEEGKWELADSLKYKLVGSKEEAQNNFFDYDFVMRGGPGQIAKLNAEPFPEDVITGLNIIAVTPNYSNFEIQPWNYLYYDRNGDNIIKQNLGKEPYRNMGWFSFVNEVGQQGIGAVWQWINPDKSIVYLTTVSSAEDDPKYKWTPFVTFNLIVDTPFTTFDQIGKNPYLNKLIQQWADTDIIPVELQYHVLAYHATFNP